MTHEDKVFVVNLLTALIAICIIVFAGIVTWFVWTNTTLAENSMIIFWMSCVVAMFVYLLLKESVQ